jgi:hypothetical protein
MPNEFVDYLNTLHNASGANENALAEAQALNPFYNKIHVNRRIGNYLASLLRDKSNCIILTGHAGDGKTGLLYQILDTLGISVPPTSVSVQQPCEAKIPGTSSKLLYTKDMSALAAADQESLLTHTLQANKHGNSSILVSNTGPLLNTFKRLQDSQRLPGKFKNFQVQLLAAMDSSEPYSVDLEDYSFLVVNMARVDNVGMAGFLLRKITEDSMWMPCASCTRINACPIYNNVLTVRSNLSRVSRFVETYLDWLHENDSRLTLRQILAQISYALTSDLSCAQVDRLARTTQTLFNYHFANALWGYCETKDVRNATQLYGVRVLRSLHLDEIATSNDYAIFVQKDLSAFDGLTKPIIEGGLLNRIGFASDERLRCSVRRFFYLFASGQSNEEFDALLGELFSPTLPVYARISTGSYAKSDLSLVHHWIVRGLYTSIVGVPRPDSESHLHVTVRPERIGVTGVQLLIREIPDSDLQVYTRKVENFGDSADNRDTHVLILKLRNSMQEHIVSLPLLDYLHHLGQGAVSTRLNPYLSHGIDRIKASLIDHVEEQEDTAKLLILTQAGPKTITLSIEPNRLVAR